MFAHVGACCWPWLQISGCFWKCRTVVGMHPPVISSGMCCCCLFGHDALLYNEHVMLGVSAQWWEVRALSAVVLGVDWKSAKDGDIRFLWSLLARMQEISLKALLKKKKKEGKKKII